MTAEGTRHPHSHVEPLAHEEPIVLGVGEQYLAGDDRSKNRATRAKIRSECGLRARLVMLVILASCVCLALDSPRLDPASPLAIALHTLNGAFVALFTLELLLKAVANGLVGEGAYLSSPKVRKRQERRT